MKIATPPAQLPKPQPELETASATETETARSSEPLALVPRMKGQGYADEELAQRRKWLEEKCNCDLGTLGQTPIPGEEMRGNIENPIGAVQMPVGVAGPLLIRGEHASGTFYVPLATTEGALVRSYERGMVVLSRAGGADVRIWTDENRVSPIFRLKTVAQARDFALLVEHSLPDLQTAAQSTTRHGKLLGIDCLPVGRNVIINFRFGTGDAQGMNMIVKAAEEACRWLIEHSPALGYQIFSGFNSEKRASGSLFLGGKGKKVTAGALIPARTLKLYLRTTPKELSRMWRLTIMGHLQANAVGYNGHYANGLTALYIACGQDVANVANSSVGITTFEETDDGDLYVSVTLPSLSVATVGGGTQLGTSKECLDLLGCLDDGGQGQAKKLAEITAATLLAGEISMAGAIASGELVNAHETYGRNRPRSSLDSSSLDPASLEPGATS